MGETTASALPSTEMEVSTESKGACDDAPIGAADSVGGGTGAGADMGRAAANAGGGGSSDGKKRGGESSSGGGGSGGGSSNRARRSSNNSGGNGAATAIEVVRERWVHVDPVQGAVDQADKVSVDCGRLVDSGE